MEQAKSIFIVFVGAALLMGIPIGCGGIAIYLEKAGEAKVIKANDQNLQIQERRQGSSGE